MERCLVTGADGFIGMALCRRLDASGSRVYRLVRRGTGPNTIAADLGQDPIVGLGNLRPEVVFHLAGRVHELHEGPGSEAEHMRVTVEGTGKLLEASIDAGVRVFVFFSSCAVMPEGHAQELDETAQPTPTTPYGRAKLRAEELVLARNGREGLTTVCLRLPMVYGPGHKGQLPKMIAAIESGWFPPLPNLGGGRSVVHVEDAVDAALLVARSPKAAGKVYIVAEPRAYTSRELYEIVLKSLGRRPPRWHVPTAVLAAAARTGDVGERLARRRLPFDSAAWRKLSQPAAYSASRIEHELGFRPTRNFADSVGELTSLRRH